MESGKGKRGLGYAVLAASALVGIVGAVRLGMLPHLLVGLCVLLVFAAILRYPRREAPTVEDVHFPSIDDRTLEVVETACEEARALLPAGVAGDQGYCDCTVDGMWEGAVACLESMGTEASAPPAFWRHLLTAAEALGARDLAARCRSRFRAG
jgi:hypothetical protein